MNMREEFEAAYAAIPPITTTRDTAWICWQAASEGKAELLEALRELVAFIDKCADNQIITSLRVDDFRTSVAPDSKSLYDAARAAIAKHGDPQ